MSLAWVAYRALAPIAATLADGVGALAVGKSRLAWAERTGRVAVSTECAAWVHAASLGEALAVGPLVHALSARDPGARLRMTAMTATGRRRLESLDAQATLAPFDAPGPVARFLDAVSPRRILLLETELWPHWLLAARARGTPVVSVSARLSERSLAGYRRLGEPFQRLVADLAAVLCQSDRDAARWRVLGAAPERTTVVGNLKNDALPRPAADRRDARRALGLDPERPLLALGCVRPGEPRHLAGAWRSLSPESRAGWQVVAVPRHAAAAHRLRGEAARGGLSDADGWRWDARPGVLAGYYAAADIAFVGGSLAPFGGHNPLEAAACGAVVLMGPHHGSQDDGVLALRSRGAIEIVATGEALAGALERLIRDPALRAARAAAAIEVCAAQRGAATRAVDQLVALGLWPVG